MALKLTVESFLQVVRQSGLIDANQLQSLLTKYSERGIDVKKSQAIADALVADDVLTKWQAEKLLNGKHKGFFLGKYRLLGLLGKGGMSSVYLAEHTLMKRRCAIKVLPSQRVNDSSYLARFHREAQAVASVDHPNIVRAYDVDCAQDKDAQIHFLVMEYVPGQSLQELVMQEGPLDYPLAMDFIRQAALGLDHAHGAGMVHRDIKPGNLLVDSTGTIKILDMGLARFFDDRETSSLTVAHEEKVLGTADYLAPEQAIDSHSVDTRADIYSLGCSLYFLLTGKPPFDEGTLTQRLMWHQTKAFPPLTDSRLDCPPTLTAILNKMVKKDPAERFQTGVDVAMACQQWLFENGGPDWQQRIGFGSHEGSPSSRTNVPSRDLQSDSVMLKDDASTLPATKISTKPPTDTTQRQTDLPNSAVAQPAKVAATPVAKPIRPVAMPVDPPAAPAIPVAKPIVPTAQPVAPRQEPPSTIVAEVSEAVEVAEPVAEPVADDGIFSLFEEPAPSAVAPDTGSIVDSALATTTAFRADEVGLDSMIDEEPIAAKRAASSPKLSAGVSKKIAAIDWKQPKVLAVLGLAASLLIGVPIWLSVNKSSDSNPSTKTGKNNPGGKGSQGSPKKEVIHTVTLTVGSSSEYTTVGRAVHAIVEGRADFESKANGKPLRFVLQLSAGKQYEESFTVDDSFPGELHLIASGSQRPRLAPPGDEPAITIKNRSGVSIEGLLINLNQFAATSRGIVVTGNSPKCQIKNCVISYFGKAGIDITEATGADSEQILIDDVTFQNAGALSFGVQVTGKEPSRYVGIQHCKFVGAMAAAIAVQAPVENLSIRQCAVSGATSAVRFAEAVRLNDVAIDQCSFKLSDKAKAGLLFDGQPADNSSGFSCQNTLFAGLKTPEALIEKNYDAKKFDSLLSTKSPSSNNWSDRAATKLANNEREIVEHRVAEIEFADSSKSSSDLYLVPKAGAEYKSAGVSAR